VVAFLCGRLGKLSAGPGPPSRADSGANLDASADADGITNPDANADASANANAIACGDENADADTNTKANANAEGNENVNASANADGNANTDTDADTNAKANANAEGNGNVNANANADGNANTDAGTGANAKADALANAKANANASQASSIMDTFLRDLGQPEYVHVLLNPLPVYGLGVALLGLIAATCMNNRGGQVVALALVFACAASVWLVVHYGEAAENGVLAMSDNDGQAWFKAHEHRADELAWIYYALALVSIGATLFPKKWPRSARPLTLVTIVLGMVALSAGAYIAHAGGKIRHKEFRNVPPPVTTEGETS
jgi:hypothetical protein